MGFGFKKSKNFGAVKFNLSKSGVGISTGVKGFRVSAGSKGVMLNAGKNGIYYRKNLNGTSPEDVDEVIQSDEEIEITQNEWGKWEKSKQFYKWGFLILLAAIVGMFFNDFFILFLFPALILIVIALIMSTVTLIKVQLIKKQAEDEGEEI